MRRRLDLAAGLVTRPPVLFLDEPTTGLDPTSRERMWEVIRELVADGATLLLTTQYLEEADQLADRIVVIDHGRVIAEGTAGGAEGGHRRRPARGHPHRGPRPGAVGALALRRRPGRTSARTAAGCGPPVRSGSGWPPPWSGPSTPAGVSVDDVEVRQPSLDDVFFALTGHPSEPTTSTPTSRRTPSWRRRHHDRHRPRRPPSRRLRHRLARPRPRTVCDVVVLTRRNLVHIAREPMQLSDVTIQPVLFTLLFVYVFGAGIVLHRRRQLHRLRHRRTAVMNLTTSAMGTAVGLSTDLTTGVIDRFRTLPMWRPAVLVGRSVADLLTAAVCAPPSWP